MANESMDIIKEALSKIQHIDEEIQRLREERKEILKQAKDDGVDSSKLNKAISLYRKSLTTSEVVKSEEEMYLQLVQETNIIKPVVD